MSWRRVSTRGVFGLRGVYRREEYSGGEACLNERSIWVERRVSTRGVGVFLRSSGEALGYQ